MMASAKKPETAAFVLEWWGHTFTSPMDYAMACLDRGVPVILSLGDPVPVGSIVRYMEHPFAARVVRIASSSDSAQVLQGFGYTEGSTIRRFNHDYVVEALD